MDDKDPSPIGGCNIAPHEASMENTSAGSMSKSESGNTHPRSSNSTSEEKYKMEHAPNRDYHYPSSTSDSDEDDLLEGEVTYSDVCPDNVASSLREKLTAVMAEQEQSRMQNMAESVEIVEKLRAMIAQFEEVQKRHIIANKERDDELVDFAAECIRRLQEIGDSCA